MAEEKFAREFLKVKVDPVMVPMVRELLRARPADVLAFCAQYLGSVDAEALAWSIVDASADKLAMIVRAALARLEATPLGEAIKPRELATLGLCFGRASNMFRAVQDLIGEVVTRVGLRVQQARAAGFPDDDACVLLQCGWWNNNILKLVPLTPEQFAFLAAKKQLAESTSSMNERLQQVSSGIAVMRDAKATDAKVVSVMIRMSAHFYELHNSKVATDYPRYCALMLDACRALLLDTPRRSPTPAFVSAVIMLLVHTEWAAGEMPADVLEALLTTPYLPSWMHAYVATEPCPLPGLKLLRASDYSPVVAAVLRCKGVQ